MDSGFWSKETMSTLSRLGVHYTMAVHANNNAIRGPSPRSQTTPGSPIDYPEDGKAEVAETTYKGTRLVVRRTRLVG